MVPINTFFAVDPGKHRSAVAYFAEQELLGAWLLTAEEAREMPWPKGSVVMENPRAYPGSKVRVNDLIDLAAAGMSVASVFTNPLSQIKLIAPSEWKGQVPKEITRKRVESKGTHEPRPFATERSTRS
jgi:hypothetical protein